MKEKRTTISAGVQDLCRKLKVQLEELAVEMEQPTLPNEEKAQRSKLMEQLKQQLAELSR